MFYTGVKNTSGTHALTYVFYTYIDIHTVHSQPHIHPYNCSFRVAVTSLSLSIERGLEGVHHCWFNLKPSLHCVNPGYCDAM